MGELWLMRFVQQPADHHLHQSQMLHCTHVSVGEQEILDEWRKERRLLPTMPTMQHTKHKFGRGSSHLTQVAKVWSPGSGLHWSSDDWNGTDFNNLTQVLRPEAEPDRTGINLSEINVDQEGSIECLHNLSYGEFAVTTAAYGSPSHQSYFLN